MQVGVVQVVRDCHSSLPVQKNSFWALQSMCSQISVVLILWLFDLIRKYYPICICIYIYMYNPKYPDDKAHHMPFSMVK